MLRSLLVLSLFVSSIVVHASDEAARGGGFHPLSAEVNLYDQYEKDLKGGHAAVETVAKQNASVFAKLKAWTPQASEDRAEGITLAEARQLLTDAMNDKIIGKKSEKKYDPAGNIGFCFGRAMWLHLELLQRGVSKDSIFKAFVIGPMSYANIMWQFHVATIVRNSETGGFLVIDPEFGQVLSLENWFAQNMNLSTDKKLRLYVTEPSKFGASADDYDKYALNDKWYNSYFKDMLAYFRAEADHEMEDADRAQAEVAKPNLCKDLFK